MSDSATPQDEFPVPLSRFLPTLRRTPDEVWSKLLQLNHSKEKLTMSGWKALLNTMKGS